MAPKKLKIASGKVPTKSKAQCKAYLDRVVFAIRALRNSKGSSRPALTKFLKEEFNSGDNAAALRKALKAGVESGVLVQVGQSFRVAGEEYQAAEDETVQITDVVSGEGDQAQVGDTVHVSYRGTLQSNGTVFDEAKSFDFTLGAGEVIKGWDQGIVGMKVGGKRQLVVPPKLGYGKKGSGPKGEPGSIPPGATLCFSVGLKKVEKN
mmetsp:Transcript_21266/g.37650  ORF Transcript_21266/g.37650 Transcript_21266/m.37650 type:complete len:207 (-) Transcript_21266:158-778(-)